eukprot:1354909-Pyramimonas_sp.AAC.1
MVTAGTHLGGRAVVRPRGVTPVSERRHTRWTRLRLGWVGHWLADRKQGGRFRGEGWFGGSGRGRERATKLVAHRNGMVSEVLLEVVC